jgi:hypothetical protein
LKSKDSQDPKLYDKFQIFLKNYFDAFFADKLFKNLRINLTEENPLIKLSNFTKSDFNNINLMIGSDFDYQYDDYIEIYKNLLNLFIEGQENIGDAILQL